MTGEALVSVPASEQLPDGEPVPRLVCTCRKGPVPPDIGCPTHGGAAAAVDTPMVTLKDRMAAAATPPPTINPEGDAAIANDPLYKKANAGLSATSKGVDKVLASSNIVPPLPPSSVPSLTQLELSKPLRTKDAIQAEYAELCRQIGHQVCVARKADALAQGLFMQAMKLDSEPFAATLSDVK